MVSFKTGAAKGGLRVSSERMRTLFDNMAQYIFEQASNDCASEEETKRIFTEELGFTDSEYADEIGYYSS